ncbi:MAG: PAC2 family protein [Dehalococcoidales bacterium]|jgi:proteasome assembly chaperone (PAC2) family protein
MPKLIKLTAKPKLKSPVLLAAWPGISNVAMIVATYLMHKLDFKELAVVDTAHFFDPIGILVKDGLIEAPQFPQSRFLYWKNQPGKSDLILFVGDDQPMAKGYELANLIIDLAQKFSAKRIYTTAAALTRIHHSESPRVWAATTGPKVAAELKERPLVLGGNLQISGLNGLLLGVAKERKMDGVCLLGEVPTYASKIQNPMAALAIIQILSQLVEIEVDTKDLMRQAIETRERMAQVAAEAMGDYIDYFTEPIWEREEDSDQEGE